MFLNLEVVVAYWLARRSSVEVMQYTLVVTVWRLATLLGAAVYFGEIEMIFVTIVCAEAIKNIVIYCVAAARAACWCCAGSATCCVSRYGWWRRSASAPS
jgi:hypothetical protein